MAKDLPPWLEKRWLSREEASQYLSVERGILRKASTLKKMESLGTGPKFKPGTPNTYLIADLALWADEEDRRKAVKAEERRNRRESRTKGKAPKEIVRTATSAAIRQQLEQKGYVVKLDVGKWDLVAVREPVGDQDRNIVVVTFGRPDFGVFARADDVRSACDESWIVWNTQHQGPFESSDPTVQVHRTHGIGVYGVSEVGRVEELVAPGLPRSSPPSKKRRDALLKAFRSRSTDQDES